MQSLISSAKSSREQYGVHIEGDLCPHCQLYLDEELNGDFTKLKCRRVLISEKKRIGIGVFQPSDPKSQDISDLVGSIDLSTIGQFGSESDPRAYKFDGEANVANRGMLEMVEMLKSDERFLYLMLTLSQEQSIKAGRFPMIYADEVIISHTNEAEYRSWSNDKKSEALRDRVIVLHFPYNLRVRDEVKIYDKLIKETSVVKNIHVDPQALHTPLLYLLF
jgi:serine protein kinase